MNEDRQPHPAPPNEPGSATPREPVTPRAEPAPIETPPPPVSERPPAENVTPLPQRPTRPALSSGEYWRRRSDNLLVQLGIDARLATRVLVIAVIAAALGALLDEVLGLPGTALRASFGGTLVAGLSGLSYAYFKGREDAPGLIMAAVAGLVGYLVWYLVKDLLGFADSQLNVLKAMVSGALAGMLGFGWLALLHWLPDRLGRWA